MGDKFWISVDGVLGLEEVNLGGCRKLHVLQVLVTFGGDGSCRWGERRVGSSG